MFGFFGRQRIRDLEASLAEIKERLRIQDYSLDRMRRENESLERENEQLRKAARLSHSADIRPIDSGRSSAAKQSASSAPVSRSTTKHDTSRNQNDFLHVLPIVVDDTPSRSASSHTPSSHGCSGSSARSHSHADHSSGNSSSYDSGSGGDSGGGGGGGGCD